MLKRASKGESSFDLARCLGLAVTCFCCSASSQGLTIPGLVFLWRAAVLWDKISSIQNDLTPETSSDKYQLFKVESHSTFLLGRVRWIVRNYLRHSSHVTIFISLSLQTSTQVLRLISIWTQESFYRYFIVLFLHLQQLQSEREMFDRHLNLTVFFRLWSQEVLKN